ncbi:MAG: hypothetical protein B6244_12175 [Candidatus Cloacimonetes bacterium 4572_55]|nr:MAG: hypothetical protein B6244_12175 [Candidatus Cloacimonetes bacterium 4572_55]
MSVKEKLAKFKEIDGFMGVAVFTPSGESLAQLEDPSSHLNLKEVGILSNNVLMNAQKAALEMGAGKGEFIHIISDRAHVLVRCYNEGTDPLTSQPGRAHIHLVLVLKDESGVGLAKMRIKSIVQSVAQDFRM